MFPNQQILEKCRANMQSQFDQWYSNLHSRGFDSFPSSLGGESPQKEKAGVSGSMSSSISTRVHSYVEAESKDDDVNDDIMAFYQAKEELLKLKSNSLR